MTDDDIDIQKTTDETLVFTLAGLHKLLEEEKGLSPGAREAMAQVYRTLEMLCTAREVDTAEVGRELVRQFIEAKARTHH
mgnify:CR=1 FL=1